MCKEAMQHRAVHAAMVLAAFAVMAAADQPGATAAAANVDPAGFGKPGPLFNNIYNIPVGKPLSRLPGARMLMPERPVTSVSITLAPVIFKLRNNGLQLLFTSPAYINDVNPQTAAFGPTIRVKRNSKYQVKITNALVDPNEAVDSDASYNSTHFYGPMDTNLHSHGLWAPPGVNNQATATIYQGSDNVFYKLKARSSKLQPPNQQVYNLEVAEEHLPGLHWAHPHKHGSTTLQASTAHFAILVEDDFDYWMPTGTNCEQLKFVLGAAVDVILDMTLLFFKYAAEPLKDGNYKVNLDDANTQIASNSSNNPLCCDKPATNGNNFGGTLTRGQGSNIYLINGGYQPVISLPKNTWQRWRMLYSGAKGFVAINIIDPDTNKPAAGCELQLYAKDGVYLLRAPRKVDGLILPSGGRLEFLVKCDFTQGKTLILSAGQAAVNVFTNSNFTQNPFLMQQEVLATIKIKPAAPYGPSPALLQEACIPNRPGYATDLRDPALAAANYDLKDIYSRDVQFSFQRGYACEVNGQLYTFPDNDPLMMPLGKVVEWSFNDVVFHVLHVHVNPFQLIWWNATAIPAGSNLGNFYQVGDYHDTLVFPMGGSTPGSYRFRFQPGNFAGYAVMHCHYLQHEDLGCMKVVFFQCPGFPSNAQPASGDCPGFKFPVPGTV